MPASRVRVRIHVRARAREAAQFKFMWTIPGDRAAIIVRYSRSDTSRFLALIPRYIRISPSARIKALEGPVIEIAYTTPIENIRIPYTKYAEVTLFMESFRVQ